MEESSIFVALGLAGMSKYAETKVISWAKQVLIGAFSSRVIDSGIQMKKSIENRKFEYDSDELLNAVFGGFISGFVTSGLN